VCRGCEKEREKRTERVCVKVKERVREKKTHRKTERGRGGRDRDRNLPVQAHYYLGSFPPHSVEWRIAMEGLLHSPTEITEL